MEDMPMEYSGPCGSDDYMQVSGSKSKKKRPKFIRIVECQVCGDKANDHIHYGAIACYSCRAFFRRGVGAADQYQCTFGQNCTITVKTRKQCQYCRFKKCLDIGMKPTWVMTDEEKAEKKEKSIKRKIMAPIVDKVTLVTETRTQYEERMRDERIQSRLERKRKLKECSFMKQMPPLTPLNLIENGEEEEVPPPSFSLASEAAVLYEYMDDDDVPMPSNVREEEIEEIQLKNSENSLLPLNTSPYLTITNEEVGFIKQLWQMEMDTSRSVPVPPNIMSMIINAARSGTHIPNVAAIQGYSICMQRVIKYATQMDVFNRLPQKDRFKLLLKNVDMVVNIRTARLLRPDTNLRDQLGHVVGWKKPRSIESSSTSSNGEKKLQLFQFFGSPWASDRNYEEKYEKLLHNIFDLKMDHMTTTLLTLMALFSDPTDTELISSHDVKGAQDHFTVLLYRYLCSEVGRSNASVLLPQYKRTLGSLQEMADIIANKRLKLM